MHNRNQSTTRIMCLTNPGAYFTSPMIEEVHYKMNKHIKETTELSPLAKDKKITLSPITLYVDDRAILTSSPDLNTTAHINTIAFEESHLWLLQRGLQIDQVKNELMYFTKSRNQDTTPSIHIPLNTPGEWKEVTPSSCMRYLSLWFNLQLKFHKHTKITASKAPKATEAIQMLGNLTSGINQHCLRQIYLGVILPIATYDSVAFWDGKSSFIKSTLKHTQNKALCLITGAFKTTPISALNIEASIPPRQHHTRLLHQMICILHTETQPNQSSNVPNPRTVQSKHPKPQPPPPRFTTTTHNNKPDNL